MRSAPRFRCRSVILAALGAMLIAPAAFSQTLEADYQLQNVLTSSAGTGIGPLNEIGFTSAITFSGDTNVDGNNQDVLMFEDGESGNMTPISAYTYEGGVQAQTNGYVDPTNYSVVLLANFNLTTDVLATKILDFQNLSSDDGLYVNDATGLLDFNGVVGASGGTPVVSGAYTQIVLTRDSSSGTVTVYENGVEAFSFDDSSNLAVLGDATNTGNQYLTLFRDDGTGLGGTIVDEDTLGDIARLRIYNGALTAQQVASLDTVVPEPTSFCVLAAAGAILLRRRRAC